MSVCRKGIREQISDLQKKLNVYKKKEQATNERIDKLLDKISDSYLDNHVGKFFELKNGYIFYIHSKCAGMKGDETLVKTITISLGYIYCRKIDHCSLYYILREAKEISREKFIRLANELALDLFNFNNI